MSDLLDYRELDDGATGCHKRQGVLIKPGYRGVGVASGSGDYLQWLDYEAEQANLERLHERQGRFTPQVEPLQPAAPVAAEEKPVDIGLTWVEHDSIRWRVEDMTPRLDGEDFWAWQERQSEAIRCTQFARTFERWVKAGCPTTKGER